LKTRHLTTEEMRPLCARDCADLKRTQGL